MREDGPFQEAIAQVREAASAKKCWSCGCLHHSLDGIERAVKGAAFPVSRSRLAERAGVPGPGSIRIPRMRGLLPGHCGRCHNSSDRGEICPAERIDQRQGWPPLPGAYTVVRYRSAVAVCILTDDALAEAVLHEAPSEVGIVGTLQTEHLGIERLILNVLANPNIRL